MKQLWLLLAVALVAGCSGPDTELRGAANVIPLFQPSRLQAFEPGNPEWIDNSKRQTNLWVWKTTGAVTDAVAFYKEKMPDAKVSAAEQATVFTWTSFPGADKNEAILVSVGANGVIKISERLGPHKHKHGDQIIKAFPPDNDLPSKK